MTLVDAVILAFVLVGALRGYRRGIMMALVGLVSYLAAAVIASVYSPSLVTWINGRAEVTRAVSDLLKEKLVFSGTVSQETDSLQALGSLSLPDFFNRDIGAYLRDILAQTPANSGGVVDTICSQLATLLVSGLAFAAVFIISVVAIRLLTGIFSRWLHGTVLGVLNRFGGMLLGAAVNVFLVGVVIGITVPWMAVGAGSGEGVLRGISEAVSHSTLVPYFLHLISWVTTDLVGTQLF